MLQCGNEIAINVYWIVHGMTRSAYRKLLHMTEFIQLTSYRPFSDRNSIGCTPARSRKTPTESCTNAQNISPAAGSSGDAIPFELPLPRLHRHGGLLTPELSQYSSSSGPLDPLDSEYHSSCSPIASIESVLLQILLPPNPPIERTNQGVSRPARLYYH